MSLSPPFTPQQIRKAYGIDLLLNAGWDGTGQTIAIIDAYDDPNIVSSSSENYGTSDIAIFNAYYGLPDFGGDGPTFTKLDQNGGTNYPSPDIYGGWSIEESLDVEWAHAIVPGANIILFEASESLGNFATLEIVVNTARNYAGVSVISMSFDYSYVSSESSMDSYFTTPNGHSGITFVGSSGDTGTLSGGGFPSVSANVLSVGGTSLTINNDGSYGGETGWIGSGGGISVYESQPSYQSNLVINNGTYGSADGPYSTVNPNGYRAFPDVAFDGDFSTGINIYDSYDSGDPWRGSGGTSFACVVWAGLIAITNQIRVAAGLTALDGPSQTLPRLYAIGESSLLYSQCFHDITSGSAGGDEIYAAAPGFDLVTGWGTPIANVLCCALAGGTESSGVYPIVLNSSATSTNTGFEFVGPIMGATYHYTVYPTLFGPSAGVVVGSGTVLSAEVNGINVSSLGDGLLTWVVYLVIDGNLSTPAVAVGNFYIDPSPPPPPAPAIPPPVGTVRCVPYSRQPQVSPVIPMPVTTYYVATTGSDSNPGSLGQPFATLEKAHNTLMNGQPATVYLRGGTYLQSMTNWAWTKSGNSTGPITVQSYPGEWAILDNATPVTWSMSEEARLGVTPNIVWQCSWSGSTPSVMPLTDRPCIAMGSMSDFNSPGGLTINGVVGGFLDGNGNLLFNIIYWDSGTNTIYFQSIGGPGNPLYTNPNTQIAVTDSAWTFDPPVSYYQFVNLGFQHGAGVDQQSLGGGYLSHDYSVFGSCKFQYNVVGIVGGGNHSSYTNNFIDLNGALSAYQGGGDYFPSFTGHTLYLAGFDMTITGNVLARQGNGGVQFTATFLNGSGLMYSTFSGNYLCEINGTEFTGTGFICENNIALRNGSTFGIYIAEGAWATNYTFSGNFIETISYGIQINGAQNVPPDNGSTSDFTVTDNFINNIGDYNYANIYATGTPGMTLPGSNIDDNQYYGAWPYFSVGPPITEEPENDLTFAQWQAALNSNAGATTWESHSTYNATAFAEFPSDTLTSLLDAGDLFALQTAVYDYVKGIWPNTPIQAPA